MLYLHPDGKTEVEANPANLADHEALLESGFKPLDESEFAEAESVAPVAPKKRKSKSDPE